MFQKEQGWKLPLNELELGTKELDCLSNDKVYWPEDNKCYDLLSSGPCSRYRVSLVLVPGIQGVPGHCSRYTGCPWSLFQVNRVSLVLVQGIQGVPGHCSRYTGCPWSLFQVYRVFLVIVPVIKGDLGPWSRYTGFPWSLVQVYRVSLVLGPGIQGIPGPWFIYKV